MAAFMLLGLQGHFEKKLQLQFIAKICREVLISKFHKLLLEKDCNQNTIDKASLDYYERESVISTQS